MDVMRMRKERGGEGLNFVRVRGGSCRDAVIYGFKGGDAWVGVV